MIVVAILMVTLLVVIHEAGHFVAARGSGVKVEEFGIGFPPRLLKKRLGKGGTIYSLCLIPLGGFVRLRGEADAARQKGSFGAARYRQKVIILLAGVVMNVVAAWLILTGLALFGLPRLIPNQFTVVTDEHAKSQSIIIAQIVEDSAAAKIGLKVGDRITAINSEPIHTAAELTAYTHAHPKAAVNVTYIRSGQVAMAAAKLGVSAKGEGQLGVAPVDETKVRYTWSAPLVAAGATLQLVGLTFAGIFKLVIGLVSQGTSAPAVQNAVGPVGVFALLTSATHFGFTYVLLLVVTISISLAVVNTLPLPALDGGRLALITLFRWLKKPLTKNLEAVVNTTGFVALITLAILMSIFDVHRFF